LKKYGYYSGQSPNLVLSNNTTWSPYSNIVSLYLSCRFFVTTAEIISEKKNTLGGDFPAIPINIMGVSATKRFNHRNISGYLQGMLQFPKPWHANASESF
jgi:hypothetical protein